MDTALILSAALMGLAGAPHCAAMCGPACAALAGPGRASGIGAGMWAFHATRVAGYAVAGAILAGGLQWLAWAGQGAAALRPLWAVLHMAALALGAWMLLTARQPLWMTRVGRPRAQAAPVAGPISAQGVVGPGRTLSRALVGSAWVAWPCGLLQSALVVSGLTHTAAAGAAAMAAFAMASMPGLQAGAWLRVRLAGRQGRLALGVRLAGLLLALASAWALGQDVWARVWAYCFG